MKTFHWVGFSLALMAGCATVSSDRAFAGSNTNRAVVALRSANAANHIAIENFKFLPATLTVTAGSDVTWVNHDGEPHTITSTDRQFGSSAMDTGDRYTYKFTKPGTYTYFCTVHPFMTGTITVVAAANHS